MNQLFDSHLHLNHPDFADDATAVWQKSQEMGVTLGVVIGYDLESSRKAIELSGQLDGLYASVGISPHDVLNAPDDWQDQIRKLAEHPKAAAIGETGLEYFYDPDHKDLQKVLFQSQIQIANELGKIVVIHLRDADNDFLGILENNAPKEAILHCFTAGKQVLDAAVARGYYISISGIVTFKSAREIQDCVPLIPENQLLIETDSPYLAPIPYRGKRCEPWMVQETAAKIAALRNEGMLQICAKTYRNAALAFHLDL